ncbi:L-ascorbate-6-phosphate lactonase UlaG [uncultured archaeon]|nr:L-ascorbate-6-phosphate lactonase UlaG [uncultured archaeon]
MVSVRYLGHASFEIEINGKIIYTDPWFNNNPSQFKRLVKSAGNSELIRKADFVLISHEHSDHLDPFDAARIVERCSAQLIGPEESISQINVNPRLKNTVRVGDSFDLNGVSFQVIEAKHPQSSYPVGYLIKSGGESVYFAGDTYDFYAMLKIDCKVAIIPIGGTYTMDSYSAVKAMKMMKAKYVIPCHYDTFDKIKVDIRDFQQRAKRDSKSEVIVLAVGERITV